jgi:hypothetical protein
MIFMETVCGRDDPVSRWRSDPLAA